MTLRLDTTYSCSDSACWFLFVSVVSPFAGTGAGAPYIGNYMDGAALTVAQFPFPNGVAVNQYSEVFVTDESWTVRMIANDGTPFIFSSTSSFHFILST